MRYFKYKNLKTTEKNASKAQYAELNEEEKRLVRKEKLLNKVGVLVFFIVSSCCIITCTIALRTVPIAENKVIACLEYAGLGIAEVLAVIGGFLCGGVVSSFIFRKAYDYRPISRNVLSKACEHLRKYYGLGEPFIVTKCYESSDIRFTNHDVCIFVADGELRITTDIKHGFSNGKKDLGCYAFNADEISIKKIQDEKLLIAELKCEKVVFRLGYRAKGFIEKKFLLRSNKIDNVPQIYDQNTF